MLRVSDIKLPIDSKRTLCDAVCKVLCVMPKDIEEITLVRRSLDARRKGQISYVHTVLVRIKNEEKILKKNIKNVELYTHKPYSFPYKNISSQYRPVVVGTGPAGLFCALMLARAGLKPLVFDRGECVEKRMQTIENFRSTGKLNLNSNVQFGEGGAGTFSDGKLTCGLNDMRMRFVLDEFVKAGAPEEISYLAKPHIGTDYLRKVVKNMRLEVEKYGGKFRFDSQFTDYETTPFGYRVEITDAIDGSKTYYDTDKLILALGHSARDTYELLYKKGIRMEKKPFSVGVRIEHKRDYINKLMYKDEHYADTLPAADYKLSCHPEGRGVYTFCMCPGGEVVCGSSETDSVVTNGMSYFARDLDNSNSALLVSVYPDDIEGDEPLSAVDFQRKLERSAFNLGGGGYIAPCQRVEDFLNRVPTSDFGEVTPSYMPGVRGANLWDILPRFVAEGLENALKEMDKKMHGFLFADAVLTGVETRSSAPLRIVRDEDMQSSQKGIYPIGEGAGYAGGIMSAAIDGIKCAEVICM